MATPILPIRMPLPLRRGLEREAERSGRSLTEIIIEAVQQSGINPVVHDDEIAPEAVRVPPAFYDFQAQHGGVPAPQARTSKFVSLRLDDPALPSFVEAARRCVTDESHSLGLRKSARATINVIELANLERLPDNA